MKGATMPGKRDIVYILRPDIEPEELRYSLRSLKNLPHRFVWFVGGQPKGFKPDRSLPHVQTGDSKWDKIRSSMYKAIEQEELSDEFFLFNDDFFVMQPFKGEFINYIDGTLSDRIEQFRQENPWLSPYARTLYKANEELKALGIKEPKNFDVHLPMLINKEQAKATIKLCSSPQMRSVYGNLSKCKMVQHDDVKVFDLKTVPEDPDYLSTNDDIFRDGKVGEYIRSCFPEPSRYEV